MTEFYHNRSVPETLDALAVTWQGLNAEEVRIRTEKYGKNKIPEPAGKSLLAIFISQFLNPLIYILIAAALVSIAIGDFKDAIFIGLIIGLNAVLGAYQEWKAENSAQA